MTPKFFLNSSPVSPLNPSLYLLFSPLSLPQWTRPLRTFPSYPQKFTSLLFFSLIPQFSLFSIPFLFSLSFARFARLLSPLAAAHKKEILREWLRREKGGKEEGLLRVIMGVVMGMGVRVRVGVRVFLM
jgi:hypothetical protein